MAQAGRQQGRRGNAPVRASRTGATATRERARGHGSPHLTPECATREHVLALQGAAGNAAVQRWFGREKKEKPRTLFDAPDESKLKLYELAKDDVQKLVNKKEQLVKDGMDPDQAEFQVYTHAPENLKRYLPLNTAFDRVKREVDRARKEVGGQKEGEIAYLMNERARKYGFKVGSGVDVDLKPKDVGKELAEKKVDQRAFEKKATEVLFIKRRKAQNALEGQRGATTPTPSRPPRTQWPSSRGRRRSTPRSSS